MIPNSQYFGLPRLTSTTPLGFAWAELSTSRSAQVREYKSLIPSAALSFDFAKIEFRLRGN
ncbi:MAG: hypothetical protein V7L20_26060 [Nostoc sp.]